MHNQKMAAAKCRKFVPNIFNKSKCQVCFSGKTVHSAEALESNKATRKIIKCCYLFVSPDLDFNNPLDRSRRWQRRFFRLYDDGELTYSVDENPDTIPQGEIDMNKCLDVTDAQVFTTHTFAIAVETAEKTFYIKGSHKDEINRWFDLLVAYPRSIKPKSRRIPAFVPTARKENVPPQSDTAKQSDGVNYSTYRGVRNLKHKTDKHHDTGMRKSQSFHDLSLESDDQPIGELMSTRFLSQSGDQLDRSSEEDIPRVPTSPIPKLSKIDISTFLQNTVASGKVALSGTTSKHNFFAASNRGAYRTHSSMVSQKRASSFADSSKSAKLRNSPPRPGHDYSRARTVEHRSHTEPLKDFFSFTPSAENGSAAVASSSSETSEGGLTTRRGSLDNRTVARTATGDAKSNRSKMRERSSSLKRLPVQLSVPLQTTSSDAVTSEQSKTISRTIESLPKYASGRMEPAATHLPSKSVIQTYKARYNATDESKMAMSGEKKLPAVTGLPPSTRVQSADNYEDLMYMKKGWLLKRGHNDKEWVKHWFVLAGNCLRYYNDVKSEEGNALDGRIDLTTCYEVAEATVSRNYGFSIKTRNGLHTLSAMTSGIRSNWMKAIRLCVDLQKTPSTERTTTGSLSTVRSLDDFELVSFDSKRLPSEGPSASSTNAATSTDNRKPARRHFSDVNPSTVGQILSVAEFSEGLDVSPAPGLRIPPQASATQETVTPEHYGSTRSHPPSTDRFVEGSDQTDNDNRINVHTKPDPVRMPSKSPSARVKERSRTKSPKLHSPPPEPHESGDDLSLTPDEEDELSTEEDDSRTTSPMATFDNGNSSGEGMLVELLETEVDTLKRQLEQAQTDLVGMHESNMDLKGRLQSLYRDDSGDHTQSRVTSQVTLLKRQLRESKDMTQKLKVEIEALRSKMDMSISKLTGTETALSEALREVKQEKEKVMKLTAETGRLRKSLEKQLQDSNSKLERNRDNLITKEKECRRLENDLKLILQKCRDHEREILKLKAVENEYRLTKEQLDDRDRESSGLKAEIRDKDRRYRKMQESWKNKIEDVEKEFSIERSNMKVHLEKMTVALENKDDIIAQLEEKLIETDSQLEECGLQASSMEDKIDSDQHERHKLKSRLGDTEHKLSQVTAQLEKAGQVERQLKNIEKELTTLKSELSQKESAVQIHLNEIKDLQQINEDLKQQVESQEQQRADIMSSDLMNLIIFTDSEIVDISSMVEKFDSSLKDKSFTAPMLAEKRTELASIMQRIAALSDVIRHGKQVESPRAAEEGMNLTLSATSETYALNLKVEAQANELKKRQEELYAIQSQYDDLELEHKAVQSRLQAETTDYQGQLLLMSQRIDDLTAKLGMAHRSIKQHDGEAMKAEASEELEGQLSELEARLDFVHSALIQQETTSANLDSQIGSVVASVLEPLSEQQTAATSKGLPKTLLRMTKQLQDTNSKLKDISVDLSEQSFSQSVDSESSEKSIQDSVKKCEQKLGAVIDKINRISSSGSSDTAESNDQLSALSYCLSQVKQSLSGILKQHGTTPQESFAEQMNSIINEIEQHQNMAACDLNHVGKIANVHSALVSKFDELYKSQVSEDSKEINLEVFATKLALESIILGEMASMLEKDHVTNNFKDEFWYEVESLNCRMLTMQNAFQKVGALDLASGVDALSSYGVMLTEMIATQSEIACLSATETPQVKAVFLASEAFTRSHLYETSDQKNQDSGHLASGAMLQGEIFFCLQEMKSKISNMYSNGNSSIKKHLQAAYNTIDTTSISLCKLMDNFKTMTFSLLTSKEDKSDFNTLISEGFQKQLSLFNSCLEDDSPRIREKSCHVIKALQTELRSTLKELERGDNVQSIDDDRTPADVLASASSFIEVLIQGALIQGSKGYLTEIFRKKVSEMESCSLVASSQEVTSDSTQLRHNLLQESQLRLKMVDMIKQQSTIDIDWLSDINNLLEPNFPPSLGPYASVIHREAVYQSQLTYIVHKLRFAHLQELMEARETQQAGWNDWSEPANDVLSICEQLLDTKYDDECEVLAGFEIAIQELAENCKASDCSACGSMDMRLQNLVQDFENESRMAHDRHIMHMHCLREEVNLVFSKVVQFMDQVMHEKDQAISEMQREHDVEIEQCRQDIKTTVSAIQAREVAPEESIFNEKMQAQVAQIRDTYVTFLKTLLSDLPRGDRTDLVRKVNGFIHRINLKTDELMQWVKDLGKSKGINQHAADKTKGRKAKTVEVDHKAEQEQEEDRQTKAALDAMKKAYEDNLKKEKERFREALKTMYTEDYVVDLIQTHEVEEEKTQSELKLLEQRYSSKAEEYKLLQERLRSATNSNAERISELKESVSSLASVVDTDMKTVQQNTQNPDTEDQIQLDKRDVELQKLNTEVLSLDVQLKNVQEDYMTKERQYELLQKLHLDLELQYEANIQALRQQLTKKDNPGEGQRMKRTLKRTPSFQRVRSPSPQSTRMREHSSRETHRSRRHLPPRDLRRSRSSPSIVPGVPGKAASTSSIQP